MVEESFIKIREPSEILFVYTDGACQNNGRKNARAGIGIYCEHFEISEKFPYAKHTNQRAELFAILVALEMIIENKLLSKYTGVHLFTDSQYSIKCCTEWIHKWIATEWKKPVKNREFIEPIFSILQEHSKIKLFHIKAHTGLTDQHSQGNEKADNLATQGLL